MPATLLVIGLSGQPNRDILVPGRNPYRAYGAIRLASNSGPRLESDWAGLKAAIAAGDLSIQLSAYETDALPEHLPGKIPYGGNIRFECPRERRWALVPDDGFCSFETIQKYPCTHVDCGESFPNGLDLGRHVRTHRD